MEGVQQQMIEEGYCPIEKMKTRFVSSVSPKGFWVCTNCRYRTKELKQEPYDRIEFI